MEDYVDNINRLEYSQVADLICQLSNLVQDMYENLKNSVLHVVRDFTVYIISDDEYEEIIFNGSEFDDSDNERTDYYIMNLHLKSIDEDDIPIYVTPDGYEYNYYDTFRNYVNNIEDIQTARLMFNQLNIQYIINPTLRNMNNNEQLIYDIRQKFRLIEANEIDEERLIRYDD